MLNTFTEFTTQAILKIGDQKLLDSHKSTKHKFYTFIRTKATEANITIDGTPHTIQPQSILVLTDLQQVQYKSGKDLVVYQFNQEFYCIKDHDKEVSCSGLLFFGNVQTPVIKLSKEVERKLETLNHVFLDEFETKDTIQAEMLRMLLARFIIICTRLLKANQGFITTKKDSKVELLRAFNMLVETHFKTNHNVAFYADKLYKSPKTLSNTFAKLNTSPLQIIHRRIVLEAKRLLTYTEQSAKEIAYSIGFTDPSHLSRLFKKQTQLTPSQFKKATQNK